MLPDFAEWPEFSDGNSYLCVVRQREGTREIGFIVQGAWDVNLGYVWDGGTGEVIPYASEAAVLQDGWEVD
jgi:hypothetical protein